MKRETKPNQENKDFKTVLKVIVSRHGPKLNAAGEKDELAAYFGQAVKDGVKSMDLPDSSETKIHMATSPSLRAVETGKVIKDELAERQTKTGEPAIKDALNLRYEKGDSDFNKLVAMQQLLEPAVTQEVEKQYPDWTTEEKEAEVKNRIDVEVMRRVFREEHLPDNERTLTLSVNELADKIGKRYAGFLKHLKLIKDPTEGEQEPFTQIEVTHSFPVMAFLKKYFVFENGTHARELSPEDFFDQIGGSIREAGSFHMEYQLDDHGKPRILVGGEFTEGEPFSGCLDTELLSKL